MEHEKQQQIINSLVESLLNIRSNNIAKLGAEDQEKAHMNDTYDKEVLDNMVRHLFLDKGYSINDIIEYSSATCYCSPFSGKEGVDNAIKTMDKIAAKYRT
jgi:hypothetical protein